MAKAHAKTGKHPPYVFTDHSSAAAHLHSDEEAFGISSEPEAAQ